MDAALNVSWLRRLGDRARVAAGLAVALAAGAAEPARADDLPVDVKLVLAVDVSWSMDREEQEIQRAGYVAAFRSEEVIDAITGGGYGRVAVTYVEWAGENSQLVVVPWTVIDSGEAADAFAASLSERQPLQMRRTSIAAGIDFAAGLFEGNGFQGMRRIIDVSGDGPNNDGRPVEEARDQAVASGITINGLPLMTNNSPVSRGYSIDNLDAYYERCVIGGGQAFMIPVNSWTEFPAAVRRKLVLELASRKAGEGGWGDRGGLPVIRVQATGSDSPGEGAAGAEAVDCLIGEKLWGRQRWSPGAN